LRGGVIVGRPASDCRRAVLEGFADGRAWRVGDDALAGIHAGHADERLGGLADLLVTTPSKLP
jgi:hypothetical protein